MDSWRSAAGAQLSWMPGQDGNSERSAERSKKLRDGGTVTEEQKDKKQDGRTVEEHSQHQ